MLSLVFFHLWPLHQSIYILHVYITYTQVVTFLYFSVMFVAKYCCHVSHYLAAGQSSINKHTHIVVFWLHTWLNHNWHLHSTCYYLIWMLTSWNMCTLSAHLQLLFNAPSATWYPFLILLVVTTCTIVIFDLWPRHQSSLHVAHLPVFESKIFNLCHHIHFTYSLFPVIVSVVYATL